MNQRYPEAAAYATTFEFIPPSPMNQRYPEAVAQPSSYLMKISIS
jgi:hypothetical protein